MASISFGSIVKMRLRNAANRAAADGQHVGRISEAQSAASDVTKVAGYANGHRAIVAMEKGATGPRLS
jgi:hypothetical protein